MKNAMLGIVVRIQNALAQGEEGQWNWRWRDARPRAHPAADRLRDRVPLDQHRHQREIAMVIGGGTLLLILLIVVIVVVAR